MLVFVVMLMLMIVVVIVAVVRMVEGGRRLGRLRFGLVFEGVGRTQRFAFQARYAPNKCHSGLETALFCYRPQLGGCCSRQNQPLWLGEISYLMLRGIAGRVKPPGTV